MNKINWQNGTLVSPAKVEIGGVIYEVTPEQYSGNTPLSAENLNQMQDNIEEAIPEVIDNLISTSTSKALSANQGKELKTSVDTLTGTILYNDTTGTGVTGLNSINLSDNISNYQRIKLVIDTSRDGSTKYAYNIIKEFNIDSILSQFSESVSYDKIVWFTFSISNNTLTITKNRLTEMSGTMSEGNYIYITKVIGYKA